MQVTVTVAPSVSGGRLIAPTGMGTPHASITGFAVDGADPAFETETGTGQELAVVTLNPGQGALLIYDYDSTPCPYPDAMFQHRASRFTRAADALVADAQSIASGVDDPAQAIVDHVTGLFTYGHVDTTYYDDHGQIPQLCGLTQGSCVDINAYLIASLRAAGVEAGYMTGYFFPAEKPGTTTDMHCWVVTRDGDETREWDIAHHLKMGVGHVRAGLNPKPGQRLPLAHSKGLNFPNLGLADIKLMSEPMWLGDDGICTEADLDIRVTPWPF